MVRWASEPVGTDWRAIDGLGGPSYETADYAREWYICRMLHKRRSASDRGDNFFVGVAVQLPPRLFFDRGNKFK